MKKIIYCCCLNLLLICNILSFAAETAVTPAEQPAPAQTSQEQKQGEVKTPTYIGVNKCRMCHPKQFGEWQKMKHSKAISVLLDDEKKDPHCLKCHTTGFEKGGYDLKNTAEINATFENVQCENCHGPGSNHMTAKKEEKKTTVVKKPNNCTDCHNPHINVEEMIKAKREAGKKQEKK